MSAVLFSSFTLFALSTFGGDVSTIRDQPGERPYEMTWANRHEPAPPTVRFDALEGWSIRAENGAAATLEVTLAQNVWDRPVGRLRYRGDGKAESKPKLLLVPPQPIALPADSDSVDVWLYGNRWDWEHPPGTPPVSIILRLRDSQGKSEALHVDDVRWQEWWLMHKRIPGALKAPIQMESIEVSGGWQADWRDIFFDSIRFYHEELPPLSFAPRPRRNLRLAEGLSPGANTGPGRLPFPTTDKTILPMSFTRKFHNGITHLGSNRWSFDYRGREGAISYFFDPQKGLGSVEAYVNGELVGQLLEEGGVRLGSGPIDSSLLSVSQRGSAIIAQYQDGTKLELRIWQKSLVIDVINTTGDARELSLGHVAGTRSPRTIGIPYLTFGHGPRPCALVSSLTTNSVFTGIWLDWYCSNGSELYAAESVAAQTARINGGVRYQARTDGQRNPMFERLFVTVSTTFEEILPSVPNPVGLHAGMAADHLWQESWGPDDYEKQMSRSRLLRAYGIERLIQCNHEITWRDGGESFTLRTRAAPKKGGDPALQRYVAHQRGLGWLAGLYSNYTDYSPVNEFWSPDAVQRQPDGNWRSAWPRCWAEKPLRAVEFDALLAPQIKAKFNPNSAYTDVQTAVAPWGYNDYDSRVPGAGTFAQTFYAYGELLRNDSKVYGGPIFSEGTYHWLYAGLADGNYALAYDGHPLADEPLLPVFDLYQIHTKECDIGMGWTANFCDAIKDWRKPENLDRAIDRFLLHTMAYGHIGWLVEEEHGLARTCRSYYMLQPVQARYALKAPQRIAYWDGGKLVSVSEALARDLPRTRRQLLVEYPGGLQLWLNDHPTDDWVVPEPAQPRSASLEVKLPPAGWAVFTTDNKLSSFSALEGTNRVDYLRHSSYTYLDGRGYRYASPEATSDGALVIRPLKAGCLGVTHVSGTDDFVIRRPYGVRGKCVECRATDVQGKSLPPPEWQDSGTETQVRPVSQAVNYVLTFR